MELRVGTAAGATDIAGQRAVLPASRDSEGTGDCPLGRASALGDGGFRRSGTCWPYHIHLFQRVHNRRAHSGLLLGLVHRFWTILGRILAGFQIAPLAISPRVDCCQDFGDKRLTLGVKVYTLAGCTRQSIRCSRSSNPNKKSPRRSES
jgi:hypothetical protein